MTNIGNQTMKVGRVVRFKSRVPSRVSKLDTCFETADFDTPIFLAASVNPPWSTTVANASISVKRSITYPIHQQNYPLYIG